MQLAPDTRGPRNLVVAYSASEIRLRDRVLATSHIVTAEQLLAWHVASVGALQPADLEPALALGVDVILLATGTRQLWPERRVLAHAASRGVGLEVMDVGAACRTFNVLVGEDRRVALAAVLPAGA